MARLKGGQVENCFFVGTGWFVCLSGNLLKVHCERQFSLICFSLAMGQVIGAMV